MSTFDINEFKFEIKEDRFGIGYKRLDVGSLFGGGGSSRLESAAAALLFPQQQQMVAVGGGGSSMRPVMPGGQSFGVGEFEDDEDVDIYQQDRLDAYDFGLEKNNKTRQMLNKSYGFGGAFDTDVSILDKCKPSAHKQQPAKLFAPPQIPDGFCFVHKLSTADKDDDVSSTNKRGGGGGGDEMSVYIKSVSARSELLGEEVIRPESVLDLMSDADREFIRQQRLKSEQARADAKQRAEQEEQSKAAMSLKSASGRNEADKEKKALRYEAYKSFVANNYKDPYR